MLLALFIQYSFAKHLWSSDCVRDPQRRAANWLFQVGLGWGSWEQEALTSQEASCSQLQQQLLGQSWTDRLSLVAPGEFSTAVKSALVLGKIFISKITHVSQLMFLGYLRNRKIWKEGEKIDWRKKFYLWIKTSGKNKGGERRVMTGSYSFVPRYITSPTWPLTPDYGDILTFIGVIIFFWVSAICVPFLISFF